mgnify:CR=1 FL=1
MPLTSLYTCSRCKREFNFSNIKYDEDKSLVCIECLGKKQKLVKKDFKPEAPDHEEVINFICVGCRFKFSVSKGSQKAIKCPYCGKTRMMIVKKYKDENDLISDSIDPRFDY